MDARLLLLLLLLLPPPPPQEQLLQQQPEQYLAICVLLVSVDNFSFRQCVRGSALMLMQFLSI